jgi:hypothetical protein
MHPLANRQGMSLVEVTIAMALMMTVMAMVMQSLIATNELTSMGAAKDDIAFDADRIVTDISIDMALTGWDARPKSALPVSIAGDRGAYYLPYVEQQALGGKTEGRGTAFDYTWRDPSMVDLQLPPGLPGDAADATTNFTPAQRDAYLASFYARSQELIYLRIATGPWQATMDPHNVLFEKFEDGDWEDLTDANRSALNVLYPNGWEEYPPGSGQYRPRPEIDVDADGIPEIPYGRIIFGGELQASGTDVSIVPQWETIDQPDYDSTTADVWREYMYAVIPSNFGVGRLVRAQKVKMASETAPVVGNEVGQFITPTSGTYGMKVQEVFSENVARIVFETFRTDDTLEVNQVRMRIYFARPSLQNPNVIITKVEDVIMAMRTRSSESDVSVDLGILVQSVGFDY